MPKDDKNEFFKALNLDIYSSENDIKKAYKKLALQCHPDKNCSEGTAKKQFEELSKAFESLVLDQQNDSIKDSDKIFFDFLGGILFGSESTNDFFSFFCGSKQHCCIPSDGDLDHRYQDDYDEEDIDGESELDSIMEIIKNRKKKGKSVPEDFDETKLHDLKMMLLQHKEEMKKDGSKKQQTSKKGKTPVPVAKPKPKSKKQLLAEQRRRDKEMQQIAMQLEEKRKEEEEKDKQRKQMEIEKQKRLEEERIKAQNEERKRREREQKEREKQQRQEQEKEERRRRQQEEEKKRKEEDEKRRKVEKEKADKEKAAKKAALQAAKEKEDQAKAAKLQSAKRQPQQQRIDQQQYPREIPPRFQKIKKQQQQHMQQQQQSQPTMSFQSNQPSTQQQQQQQQQQQNRAQVKPQPPVGKKKDPNRFTSKEYAGLINEGDDLSWPKGQSKGSGWVATTEDWEQETDKWGAVDRDWGGKEGTTWQNVVDRTDSNSWPAVSSKTDSTTGTTSNLTISKPSDITNTNATQDMKSSNSKQPPRPHEWNATSGSVGLDTWDSACDDSIDRALDAVDTKHVAAGAAGPGSGGWGGISSGGGLGGIIGTPLSWDPSGNKDVTNNTHSSWTGDPAAGLDALSWSKTPGKGPKLKQTTEVDNKKPNVTATSTWGGTPADSSSAWVERSEHSKKIDKTTVHNAWENKTNSQTDSQTSSRKISSDSSDKLKAKGESSGWGDSASSWDNSPDITGTACWDSAIGNGSRKVVESKDSQGSQDKGWLESNAATSSSGTNNVNSEEPTDASWDGWTTASSKRNRAPKPAPQPTNSDSNAWLSRSLKQLLDMGFKQEDADKALRANHMNIESAIGDLLSMASSSSEDPTSTSSTTTTTSKDQTTLSDGNNLQNQQQAPAKQNRKQRRKTQQQQQNAVVSKPTSQESQDTTEASKSTTTTTAPTMTDTETSSKNVKIPAKANTLPTPQSAEKPKTTQSMDQQGPQGHKPVGAAGLVGGITKRTNTGLMQPPTPAMPPPLRTPMSHPILQQQLMQQYHLQLRMGGLLQSQLTPQQFALFQQMAQLRIVQQGLAQQQLNQKHVSVQAQQQLYQQQQQVALMIAQMQQQVIQQQQPGQANRFPSPTFPLGGVPTQPPSQAANTGNPQPHKTNKPSDKTLKDAPPVTSEQSTEISQAKDVSPVSNLGTEERAKQSSPAPQSRLTQWKQPLLPDPEPVTSASSNENPANISPRPSRISDSISSRWGVDASPRLSADPPEFKPGVPWRPRSNDERLSPKEDDKMVDNNVPSTSPPSPSKQRPSSFTSESSLGGQYQFGIGASPWQSSPPDDNLLKQATAIRPPPGLNSQNVFPETATIEQEHSSWVKNLIDGAPPSFAQNGPTKDFNFGQLSFPMTGPSWSTQDGHPLTEPDPKPWAAPGGPSSSTASPSINPLAAASTGPSTSNALPTSDVTKAVTTGISSWSVNQPIPSAEEKLSQPGVPSSVGDKRPLLTGENIGQKGASSSLSTWLMLRNIPPNADINAIRNICQQHGPLQVFQYNMRYGNSLIRYGSKDRASAMRKVLSGINIQGSQLVADFATDSDIAAFFEQQVDWSSNQFQDTPNYSGNKWPGFQSSIGGQTDNRVNPALNQVDNKQPSSLPSSTPMPPTNINWGAPGTAPIPSQLWGTTLPGTTNAFPSQGMWSFTGNPEPSQSGGSSDNGLVSPSMTTFLPPGLLNGGESV